MLSRTRTEAKDRFVDYPALSSTQLIVIIIGYGLGCISTGYYLVRLRTGQDIRKLGSGSMGGRNVGRVLGRSGFALTMAGDTVKGIIAVRLPLHDLVLHFQYLHNPH